MNVLGFFAHPDDETVLCGGVLALLASLNARVTVLCATRGEGGEVGEPPLCTREALGAVREAELRCAIQALGCSNLELLGYIDPTVGPDNQLYPYSDNLEILADQVIDHLIRSRADVLISHGSNGEYGHPAHKLSYQASCRAVEKMGASAPLFYTMQGAFANHPRPRLMNPDDPANLILDAESVRNQKTQATLCHRTQHALFVRHTSEEMGRSVSVAEVVRTVESLHRAWPPVEPGQPVQDDLACLLLNSGAAHLNQ